MQNLTIPILQELVRLLGPTAVVAGGAVRDVLNGRNVKDIDVFLLPECRRDKDLLVRFCKKFHTRICDAVDDEEKLGLTEEYPFNVVTFPVGPKMFPTQFIFTEMESHEEIVKSFDFGLCQCWVTGGKLKWTPAYWKDADRKTITKVNNRATKEHLSRIVAKYPNYRLERCWGLL